MVSYEERNRAEQWIGELEALAGSSLAASEATIDARLAAFSAIASARAQLILAESIDQAVRNLRDDVVPQIQAMFGGR